MELPAWYAHILGTTRDIQALQLTRELAGMHGLNSRLGPSEEEALDALVAEALYHASSVSRTDTRVKLAKFALFGLGHELQCIRRPQIFARTGDRRRWRSLLSIRPANKGRRS